MQEREKANYGVSILLFQESLQSLTNLRFRQLYILAIKK